MAYVCARQTASAHESVAGTARPTCLDQKLANAQMQSQKTADHRRVADHEAMRVPVCDLNTCARTISFTGERLKGRKQPFDSGRARQIVCVAQGQILRHIMATGRARPALGFGHRYRSLFVQLAHQAARLREKRKSEMVMMK